MRNGKSPAYHHIQVVHNVKNPLVPVPGLSHSQLDGRTPFRETSWLSCPQKMGMGVSQ